MSVIANEHYSDYVGKLQTEFVEDGIYKPPIPSNARAKRTVKLRKSFDQDVNFKAIWQKISKKTNYSVQVDTARLVKECSEKINQLAISKRQINITRAGVNIAKDEIKSRVLGSAMHEKTIRKSYFDCVNFIKDETNLTRQTVVTILRAIKVKSFLNNPDRFIFEAVKVINDALVKNYIERITYVLNGDEFNSGQFEKIESHKDNVQNLQNKCKSIYDAIVYSSDVEKNFAIELDNDERIKLFIKLPGWFTVNTPIGGYVPDWAIVTVKVDINGNESKEKIYFVIETKGTLEESSRRGFENQKIECAKRHFEIINVRYKDVASYRDFERELQKGNIDTGERIRDKEKSDLFFSDVIPEATLAQGYLPIYDLQAVATSFREQRIPSVKGWKSMNKKFKEGYFIAQVVGKSMGPTIKDGSWCLFRPDQGGSRNGKIVLVESRKVTDPETGLQYTVKRYHSDKKYLKDETWVHKKITLSPDNKELAYTVHSSAPTKTKITLPTRSWSQPYKPNKEFKDIGLKDVREDEFYVVAEWVEALL